MSIAILYHTSIAGASSIKNVAEEYAATHKAPIASVAVLPISDGGKGFLDAIEASHGGCRRIAVTVRDRHLAPKETSYLISHDGKSAYIEADAICGYDPADSGSNPATTFTHGIGEAIADALSHNCRNFVIGINHLATIDAGLGALNALGYKMLTHDGTELRLYRGSEMLRVTSVTDSKKSLALKRCRFTIACNDDAAFYASTGPARRNARNLGSNEVTADILDNGLRNMASIYFKHNGRDVSYATACGAGGGLAGAFVSFFNAKLKPATEIVPGSKCLCETLKQASAAVMICPDLSPTVVSSPAFLTLITAIKRSGTPLYCMAQSIEDMPMLHSLGIDNITHSANPADDLMPLLDKITHKKSD